MTLMEFQLQPGISSARSRCTRDAIDPIKSSFFLSCTTHETRTQSNAHTYTHVHTDTYIGHLRQYKLLRNLLEPLRSAPVTNHEHIFATCHDVSSRQPTDLNCIKSILSRFTFTRSLKCNSHHTVSLQCMCMDTVRDYLFGYSTSSSLLPIYSGFTPFGNN